MKKKPKAQEKPKKDLKSVQWWDPHRVRDFKELQATRKPQSAGDIRTAMEAMRYSIEKHDPSLFEK